MKTVDLGDIRLNVVDEGSGTPLLLVHGFPLDHSMWRYQIEEFSNHCRVIAPDLRGFGKSDVPGDQPTNMEVYADDLRRLLDALHIPEPIVFCGLSMGGYIAWQFWRKYDARVAAFVLCDTRAIADAPEAAQNRYKLADRVLKEGPAPAAEAMLPKFFAPSTVAEQPGLVEQVRQTILATDPRGIAAALRGMAVRRDVRNELGEITAPTLVVVGEHDAISSVNEMRSIADAIPGSAWMMVPKAGHMSPLENPQVFNDSLAHFLTL